MISFKVDVDPTKTFILILKVLSQVFVKDNGHLAEKERSWFELPVHMKQTQDVKLAVLVDIQNLVTNVMLALLVIASERPQPLDEVKDSDLLLIFALRHP